GAAAAERPPRHGVHRQRPAGRAQRGVRARRAAAGSGVRLRDVPQVHARLPAPPVRLGRVARHAPGLGARGAPHGLALAPRARGGARRTLRGVPQGFPRPVRERRHARQDVPSPKGSGMFVMHGVAFLAQAAAPAADNSPMARFFGGGMSFPVMMALMFAILYFIVIRPQNAERKKLQQRIEALKKGDKVLTTSGIFATVVTIE